ncbi:MAG: MmgE/PrpD family protein [Chloroflexota bacterium]
MTQVEQLASFVARASWEDLSDQARRALKVRVLDSLGCALGALDGGPILDLLAVTEIFGGNGLCTLIGGGHTAPDRAAFYNGALVRYLDFNDIYLAPGETCHPSDNLGAVLAAAEFAGASGRDLLTALAVSYQVQCRLSDVAPVRQRGFDHVSQGTFAAAAGAAKALGLDVERTANGLAISGTAYNALRVTRTGLLSNWKGLAYPDVDRNAVHAVFLARQGITGPPQVFEGNKGWQQSISGTFELDWAHEDLERVTRTDLKQFNAEAHSQSSLEALLDLMRKARIEAAEIDTMQVDTFQVAFDIIGGGEEGNKQIVETKEQADHSLPYMMAVAALEGRVLPAQYRPERVVADDVQSLLRRVTVRPVDEFSRRFPAEHCSRVTVVLKDGRRFEEERRDYEGFRTRPMSWESAVGKFTFLGERFLAEADRRELVDLVVDLEHAQVADLARVLARAHQPIDQGVH